MDVFCLRHRWLMRKADASPVTAGRPCRPKSSSLKVCAGLFPDIPCVAEEEMADRTVPVRVPSGQLSSSSIRSTEPREFINQRRRFYRQHRA